MRKGVLAATLAVFAAIVLSGCSQTVTREFATDRECMNAVIQAYGPPMGGRHPSCTRIGDGPWTAVFPKEAEAEPGFATSASSGFGTFLMFALLWAAVPPFLGASIADKRGQPVGTAVLMCIVLGWLGLLLVHLGYNRPLDEMQSSRTTPPSPPPERPRHDIAGRLRELDVLRKQGLITETEHEARRQRILDEV